MFLWLWQVKTSTPSPPDYNNMIKGVSGSWFLSLLCDWLLCSDWCHLWLANFLPCLPACFLLVGSGTRSSLFPRGFSFNTLGFSSISWSDALVLTLACLRLVSYFLLNSWLHRNLSAAPAWFQLFLSVSGSGAWRRSHLNLLFTGRTWRLNVITVHSS